MRGMVSRLGTPHPLAETLPPMLSQDEFLQRMCGGLDEVLAPVFATLDAFTAYLDPRTTAEDMIAWLASWIGLTFQPDQTAERRRALLVAGISQLAWRGTVRGVRSAVETAFAVTPDIIESGGSAWSAKTGGELPGARVPRLVVRLVVPKPDAIDRGRLDALVTMIKPAHIPHVIEVLPVREAPTGNGSVHAHAHSDGAPTGEVAGPRPAHRWRPATAKD